jgi:hypothetical protein
MFEQLIIVAFFRVSSANPVLKVIGIRGVHSQSGLKLKIQKYLKSDLTLIEINVICEVPFYFIKKTQMILRSIEKKLFL